MRTDTPVTVYRKDYQPYPYDIPQVSSPSISRPTAPKSAASCRSGAKPRPAPTPRWCSMAKSWNSFR